MTKSTDSSGGLSGLLIASIVISVLAAVAGGVYMSGAADDFIEWAMTKFLVYKAKGEEKALEKTGSEAAQNFLKGALLDKASEGGNLLTSVTGELKKNPVVSNDKLNSIQSGLGDEASKEFGNFGGKKL
jgi:uncharacterized protein YneF (UPF0154 family)